jgi:hypothetical protein
MSLYLIWDGERNGGFGESDKKRLSV